MSYEITGKLIEKFDEQSITDSFKKREFVIEKTDTSQAGQFTELIKFQLTQDRCSLIDQVALDDEVKVHFNIRGRKWEKEGKVSYFTNLEAWRIEKNADSLDQTKGNGYEGIDLPATDEGGDLPF